EDDPHYLHDVVLPRYVGLLDAIAMGAASTGASSFASMTTGTEAIVARIAADPAQKGPSGNFALLRNDCVEGYFAHPRWRDRKAVNLWPSLQMRPQYPSFMP